MAAASGQPSALLSAATRLLHYVVRCQKTPGMDEGFATAMKRALSACSENLSTKMMLCACLGGLSLQADNNKKHNTQASMFTQDNYDAIFTALEQVMEVPSSVIVGFYCTSIQYHDCMPSGIWIHTIRISVQARTELRSPTWAFMALSLMLCMSLDCTWEHAHFCCLLSSSNKLQPA